MPVRRNRILSVVVPQPNLFSYTDPVNYRLAVAEALRILAQPGYSDLFEDYEVVASSLVTERLPLRRPSKGRFGRWYRKRVWVDSLTVQLRARRVARQSDQAGEGVMLTLYLKTPLPDRLEDPRMSQTAVYVYDGTWRFELTDHSLPPFGNDGVLPWDDEVRILILDRSIKLLLRREEIELRNGVTGS